MQKKVEVDSNDIFRAWEHWCEFSKNRGQKLSEDAFFDFLDPVRQSDLRRDVIIIGHEEDVTGVLSNEGMEVSEQVERRIALLAGPHFHAVLMASLDRFNYAHLSWGKKFLRKFSTTNGY